MKRRGIYAGRIVKLDRYDKRDKFIGIEGKWVNAHKVIVLPVEWTTYSLIATGFYLFGLISAIILS